MFFVILSYTTRRKMDWVDNIIRSVRDTFNSFFVPIELEMDLSNYQALEIRVWHKRMRSGICRETWESAEYTRRIKLREVDITKCVPKCRQEKEGIRRLSRRTPTM